MIQINETTYKLACNFKTLITFENITKRAFKGDCMLDYIIYFYCALLQNRGFKMSFEAFLTLIEEQPNVYDNLMAWFTKTNKELQLFNDDDRTDGEPMMISDLYSAIVGRGLMTADYFMYKATPYECKLIMQQVDNDNRNSWEQTRNIMYIIAQVNSRKELEPSDVIKFSWDKETIPDIPTDEELEELRAEAKEFEALFKNEVEIKKA